MMNNSDNPYFSIWFKTTATIDKVLAKEVNFKFSIPIALAVLSTFVKDWDKDSNILDSLMTIMIGTAMGYFITGHFLPWLMIKTGKIWNGKSNIRHLQLVFGLAHIPFLLILVLQSITLPAEDIRSSEEVSVVVQFLAWIFFVRILIIGISRVQGFTYGQAIVNMAVSVLPFLLLKLIIG